MANANDSGFEGTQYSFVEDLISSVPEIAQLVKDASSQGWDATRFANALMGTSWYRDNSNTARTMIALQASDPSTYSQKMTQAEEHVAQISAQMGIKLTQAQINSYATVDLYQGLDDATLSTQIGKAYTTGPDNGGNNLGGTAADLSQQINQLSHEYGIPVTQTWIDSWVKQGLTTGQNESQTLAGVKQNLMNQAISTYPSLAEQIKSGMTTKDIAQPYIASMSQILEVPDTSITLQDSTIQKALQNVNPSDVTGTGSGGSGSSSTAGSSAGSPMTLYDFQNQLRQDPRWQKTNNAKESAYTMLGQLGQDFGFST